MCSNCSKSGTLRSKNQWPDLTQKKHTNLRLDLTQKATQAKARSNSRSNNQRPDLTQTINISSHIQPKKQKSVPTSNPRNKKPVATDLTQKQKSAARGNTINSQIYCILEAAPAEINSHNACMKAALHIRTTQYLSQTSDHLQLDNYAALQNYTEFNGCLYA